VAWGRFLIPSYLSKFFHCKQLFFKVIRTEIYHTDQGSQHTREAFTELLKSKKDQGQHGCERQGLRQCFCRAALEDRETKRSLSERIPKYPRMPRRIWCLLCAVEQAERASIPRLSLYSRNIYWRYCSEEGSIMNKFHQLSNTFSNTKRLFGFSDHFRSRPFSRST